MILTLNDRNHSTNLNLACEAFPADFVCRMAPSSRPSQREMSPPFVVASFDDSVIAARKICNILFHSCEYVH